MWASRIFCLARTNRRAIAGSGTRKPRAMSSVLSPHRVRRVRATWASRASAGWQQVKINRSRSSPNGSSLIFRRMLSSASANCCSASAILCSSSRLESKRALRRSASTPLCCAVEISHARGFAGIPRSGHCSRATANASCMASSARSKLPSSPISVARILPDSSRNTFSISIRLPANRVAGWTSSAPVIVFRRLVVNLHVVDNDRPHLERTEARRRNPRRQRNGIVQVLGLDHVEAAELFLGLRERSVGDHSLLVAYPHRSRGRDGLQLVAGFVVAAFDDVLGELAVFFVHGSFVGLGHFVPAGLVVINQQEILHGSWPPLALYWIVERLDGFWTTLKENILPGTPLNFPGYV